MGFWSDIASPFEAVGDALEDGVDYVVDGAQDLARDIADVGEMIGEGVVDGVEAVGGAIVTFGEGAAAWSASAAGDVVDWVSTSAAEVVDWCENAAGNVAAFAVDVYEDARDQIVAGATWLYEQIAKFFYERMPELGGYDPLARTLAESLFTPIGVIANEQLAKVADLTLVYDVYLKASGGTASANVGFGFYVDRGGWGFCVQTRLKGVGESAEVKPGVSLGVRMTTVFGGRERASGAKVVKIGGKLGTVGKKLGAGFGASVLFEADLPPLLFGFRVSFELAFDPLAKDKKQQPGEPLKPAPKYKLKADLPKPDGELVEDGTEVIDAGLDEVIECLSDAAPNWDAAGQAAFTPGQTDRILATAAAAALSPFFPRYSGELRTAAGATVHGNTQGALGIVAPGGEVRRHFVVVAGLGDPAHVAIEAIGPTPMFWVVKDNGEVGLAPYSSGIVARATFKVHRGTGGRGIALESMFKPGKFVLCTRVIGDMVMPLPERLVVAAKVGHGGDWARESTFLLDRPLPLPDKLSPVLRPGEVLRVGQYLRSADGQFHLVLRDTGSLAVAQRRSLLNNSPNTWILHDTPGIIQDEPLPAWVWSSPKGQVGQYFAFVRPDGRLAVHRGPGPEQDGGLHWCSEVLGAPGPCFAAITPAGSVTMFQGTPEAPGELVWTGTQGARPWATRRRRVALRGPGGGFLTAAAGGGAAVQLGGPVCGGWQTFELLDLYSGKFALRAQGRQFVGKSEAANNYAMVAEVDELRARQTLTIELVGDPAARPQRIRIKVDNPGEPPHQNYYGGYFAVGQGGIVTCDYDQGEATVFELIEIEHDLSAQAGRLVTITAQHSGQALEVECASPTPMALIRQTRRHGGESQKWILRYHTDGHFSLIARHSKLALDVRGASTADGAELLQWHYHGEDNQRFALLPVGDGTYRIRAKHSGRVVAIESGSGAPWARAIQWASGSGGNEKFFIELAPPVVEVPPLRARVSLRERVGEEVSLRPVSDPTRVVRHRDGLLWAEPREPAIVTPDSGWKIVPGLTDPDLISLESVDRPGFFLHHANGRACLGPPSDAQIPARATWRAGLGVSGRGFTLSPADSPQLVLRRAGAELVVSGLEDSPEGRAAASFDVRPATGLMLAGIGKAANAPLAVAVGASGSDLAVPVGQATIELGMSPSLATLEGAMFLAASPRGASHLLVALSVDGSTFANARIYPNLVMGSAPTLAALRGLLLVAYRGTDGALMTTHSVDAVGFATPANRHAGHTLAGRPALAMFREELVVAYRTEQGKLATARSRTGHVFDAPVIHAGIDLAGDPSLCEFRGELVVAYRSAGGPLALARSADGASFGAPTLGLAIADQPALAVHEDSLYIAARPNDGTPGVIVTATRDGASLVLPAVRSLDVQGVPALAPRVQPPLRVYEHGDYGGRVQALATGRHDLPALSAGVGNDRISSLRVPRGYEVTCYQHGGFAGASKRFTADASWIGNDFNDVTSSVVYARAPVAADTLVLGSRVFKFVAKHSGQVIEVAGGSTQNNAGLVQRSDAGAVHQRFIVQSHASGAVSLVAGHSGRALDIPGAATTVGLQAIQWDYHGQPHQLITLVPAGDGTVHLIMRHSGLALSIAGASTAQGAAVVQAPLIGGDHQRWRLIPLG